MKTELLIRDSRIVHTLPGIWSAGELRRLLEVTEFEDLGEFGDDEVLDVALMALQELGHQRACEAVLEVVFGDSMKPGLRQNLVDDLQDDDPWQDFSVVHQQRGVFVAVVLMHQAFANRYPMPDARELRVEVTGAEAASISDVDLIRSMGAAMDPRDVLRRLYEAELERGPFDDAAGMIWHREAPSAGELLLVTAAQWLGSLARGDRFKLRTPGAGRPHR